VTDAEEEEGTPRARPLSLEPDATRGALARGCALLVVFLAASAAGRRWTIARSLAMALAVMGAVVAATASIEVVGLWHWERGASEWHARARAPFVNPNHLATFLELALGLALGLALSSSNVESSSRPHPPL